MFNMVAYLISIVFFFFFQAEDGIRDKLVTGVQTCALPISSIGTMIEVPRAALIADKMAQDAEFFSFGTNDLTQMTFGYSRDDVAKFLPDYLQKGLLPHDPFSVLDQEGVGELIRIGIERGRRTRPDLKIGICGEHGGEPSSVEFCHKVGMTYVSCSPFMIPIARLSAAQARLRAREASAEGAPSA